MSTYYANDKYNAVLTAGYSVGQTTLYVSAVPNHVPTIIVAAKGTENETVFAVTDKTTNSLTGVSRLRGANVNLDAQTPLTCLNNEEFINQLADFVSATQPSCGIKSASFTTTNGAEYIVGFNAEQWDTHGFHDNTTNNSRITIPTGLGGRYLMTCSIMWEGKASATGWRRLYLTKDGGVDPVENFEVINDGGAGGFGVDIKNYSLIVSLAAGSYYELKVAQGSGGDLTCYGVTWQIYKLP